MSNGPLLRAPGLVLALVACTPDSERSPYGEDAGSTQAAAGSETSTSAGMSTSTGSTTSAGASTTGSSTATSSTAPAPAIELGTGLSSFQPLDDGDEVELVAGIQGGWHVDVALRARDLNPAGVSLRYQGFAADTGALISFETLASLTHDNVIATDQGWDRLGDRVVFDIESADAVLGASVCLVVEIAGPSFQDTDERCVTVSGDATPR